jgi:hypothetical protein
LIAIQNILAAHVSSTAIADLADDEVASSTKGEFASDSMQAQQ